MESKNDTYRGSHGLNWVYGFELMNRTFLEISTAGLILFERMNYGDIVEVKKTAGIEGERYVVNGCGRGVVGSEIHGRLHLLSLDYFLQMAINDRRRRGITSFKLSGARYELIPTTSLEKEVYELRRINAHTIKSQTGNPFFKDLLGL